MTDYSCENAPDTKSHPGYSLSFLYLLPFIISPFVFAVCPPLHFHTLCISELPGCHFFPGWRRSKKKTPSFPFNLPSNPVREVMVVPISQVVQFRIMFSQVHTAIERWSWDRNLSQCSFYRTMLLSLGGCLHSVLFISSSLSDTLYCYQSAWFRRHLMPKCTYCGDYIHFTWFIAFQKKIWGCYKLISKERNTTET